MRRFLTFLIILSLLPVLLGCNSEKGDYEISFDDITGTLTLSGKGKVVGLYGETAENDPIEREKIKYIKIKEGITELQDCFNNMDSLLSFQNPRSLKTICNSFKGASKIDFLYVPKTIETISDGSFSDTAIGTLQLTGAIHLKNGAFDRLERLSSLQIPKGSVCEGVFKDCPMLSSVVVEENVQLKDGGGRANFSRSDSDDFPVGYLYPPTDGEDLRWGEGGRYKPHIVSEGSWYKYQSETTQHNDVPINSFETEFDAKTGTLTVIGEGDIWDFHPLDEGETKGQDNHSIKKLVLSEGITGVYSSFAHLVRLREIEFPSTLEEIDNSFFEAMSIEKLVVPATVKKIVNGSFSKCYSLKDLQFEGMIELGHPYAFSDLAIERVIIPEGSGLYGAFDDCNYLKEVVLGPRVHGNVGRLYPVSADDDDVAMISNFSTHLIHGPRVYIYMPQASEGDPTWLKCGEYNCYNPITLQEGENWEDYKDEPLPPCYNHITAYKEKKNKNRQGTDKEYMQKYEMKVREEMKRIQG